MNSEAKEPSDYNPVIPKMDREELPDHLADLMEQVAEDVHNIWAAQRFADGWCFGEERNDDSKTHPCLVPYQSLCDEEKEYDRLAALQTIRSITDHGYVIVPPEAALQSEHPRDRFFQIVQSEGADKGVFELWKELQSVKNVDQIHGAKEVVQELARRALKIPEFLLASDIAQQGLEWFPEDSKFTHIFAMTRVHMMDLAGAEHALENYRGEWTMDLVALRGRIGKERWITEPDQDKRQQNIEEAYTFYREARTFSPRDEFPIINEAACLALAGNREKAGQVAQEVIDLIVGESEWEGSYWKVASMAEAYLIQGDQANAIRWYQKAIDLLPSRKFDRDFSSTRRQALNLARTLYGDDSFLLDIFPRSSLVIFVGHMIAPNGGGALKVEDIPYVREAIGKKLEEMKVYSSYSSAASGSDILFLEEMRKRGGASYVFLPWPDDLFKKTSVHPDWHDQFGEILDQAEEVRSMSQHSFPETALSFEYTNRVMLGTAIRTAAILGLELSALAVWNGREGSPGGTDSFLSLCRNIGIPSEVIHLQDNRLSSGPETVNTRQYDGFNVSEGVQDIKAMLFADAAGYSKLSEVQIPVFVREFFGQVSELLATSSYRPIINNTWGDALYMVFNRVFEAGAFALELREMIQNTDWKRCGLPEELNVRIGLHAGPVYATHDPVIREITFNGYHVSWAARIEPKTPVGEIFASEEFVALSELEPTKTFSTPYVGTMELAKKFARKRIYRIAPLR